jgi:uncharacterized lipoprotein YddW (UPF0748 family)
MREKLSPFEPFQLSCDFLRDDQELLDFVELSVIQSGSLLTALESGLKINKAAQEIEQIVSGTWISSQTSRRSFQAAELILELAYLVRQEGLRLALFGSAQR